MKDDWKYYREPAGIPYFGYEECKALTEQLTTEINNAPMTATERQTALAGVKKRVQDHAAEQNKPYMEAKAKLEEEFWADAREELGYTEFLSPEGVSALEYKAYEDGHSSGHPEVFCQLQGLVDFARKMVEGGLLKVKMTNGPRNGGVPVKRFTITLPESCEVNVDEENGVIIIDN